MALDTHLKFRLIKTQVTNIKQSNFCAAFASLSIGALSLMIVAWLNQWWWLLLLFLALITAIIFFTHLIKNPLVQPLSQTTAGLLFIGVLINLFSNQGNHVLSIVALIVYLTYIFVNLLQNWTLWLILGLLLFCFFLIPTSAANPSALTNLPTSQNLQTVSQSSNFILTNYLIVITYLGILIALLTKLKARLSWLEKHYNLYNFGLLASCLIHQLIQPIESSFHKTQLIQHKINKTQHHNDIERLTQELLLQLDLTKKIIGYYQPINHMTAINQTINVSACIQQCLQILESNLRQNNVQVRVNLNSSLKINGNPYALYQVLLNLITNAIESFSNLQTHKLLSVSVERTAGKIFIKIKDNGQGMTRRQIKHLPEAFSSHKQQAGLGFYLANQIIQHEFQGKIKVKSKKNRGTLVEIQIPHNSINGG
jgi:signal transduction histidine kinase